MAHTGHVNTTQVRRGRDGKLYSARPLTTQERGRAIRLAHRLVHGDGLSVRAAQAAMIEQHGIRRSVGAITTDLNNFVCPSCAEHPDT